MYFPYIIPYNQTQECDIYGPICQTGSITVGVKLTTVTTTTVLPCSSYLTAQSAYLNAQANLNQGSGDEAQIDKSNWPVDVWDWLVNFGQSPQCRSYAQEYNTQQMYTTQQYTFNECGNSKTIYSGLADCYGVPGINWCDLPQIPPGLVRRFSHFSSGTCCGSCTLDFSELRLYYFPEGNFTDCQSNQTSNFTLASTSGRLEKRMLSLIPNGRTAVVGENTLCVPYLSLLSI